MTLFSEAGISKTDLLLGKTKWITDLTSTNQEDSSECLFSLREGECDWTGPPGIQWQDQHTGLTHLCQASSLNASKRFPSSFLHSKKVVIVWLPALEAYVHFAFSLQAASESDRTIPGGQPRRCRCIFPSWA